MKFISLDCKLVLLISWYDFANGSMHLANSVISSPFFHNYGLIILFVYVALPLDFVPVPLETFMIPLMASNVNLIFIFLIAWFGEIVGSIGLYLLAKHGHILITKSRTEIGKNHFVFKYRFLLFATAPILFFTGDTMMVIAGLKHVKIQDFILPMSIGIFGRTLIAFLVSLGLVSLPIFFR